jgi:outer membrane protein insertion porin family
VSAAVDTVVAVNVQGNQTVDDELVRRSFGLATGTRYSLDAVRRGIRRLYDKGFFSDVAVLGDPAPGGFILTIQVTELPRVGTVEFTGNKKIKEKDLLEAMGLVAGKMADERLLARTERSVRRLYEEKGYTRVGIHPRYLPGDTETRRILLLEIAEGSKVRVEKIRFVGLRRLEGGDLKGVMKQGTTGFLKGGVYKPEVLKEDPGRIEGEMAKHGFRDGEVLGYDVLPGSKDDRVVVEVRVREGPLYYNGGVRWEGNEAIPTPVLYGVTEVEPGTVFNQEAIDGTVTRAYEAYADRGYLYLSIQPDYAVSDSTVDVSFRVTEGEPSKVHDILITGNTRTKEKVIRRQLVIRPGDLFRRNLLVRSQRELQQLGFFNDIQVNSRPVPNSSDIDLVLDVEERQVGTASAGFGFSSSVGLTGFMELGHTNLFGNGQSLNLRMERGRRRNNAELSLTEPWFLGTPTSVGVDLFSTNRILRGPDFDLEIRRVGGALRLGRPLPIPYTRLFASYRLEGQKVVDESTIDTGSDDTAGTRTRLTGFRLDQETSLSSSLAFTLVRNSTDHPIYPTVGSNARLRAELSGGPVGGDQVFQKYELDVAQYLRPLRAGGWRPIFMVRSRLGAVGGAFRDRPLIPTEVERIPDLDGAVWDTLQLGLNAGIGVPVPNYLLRFPPESNELFRLGGTTFNPLRGYDDFEIVPVDNINRRFLVTETTDSTGAKTYAVSPSSVYYPGGKYMFALTTEWQFTIADPLHGLLFFDLGGTWNDLGNFRWDTLHRGAGIGIRMEVPLLGLIGFDYGYGFDRLNRATGRYDKGGWEPHIQFGRLF